MPIGRVPCRECPVNIGPGKSALNVQILSNVIGIVIVDESVTNGARKKCERADEEQDADHCRSKARSALRRSFRKIGS
jgi:hypothetical protein